MPRWILPLNSLLALSIIAVLALIAADTVSFKMASLYPKTARPLAAPALPAMVSEDLLSFSPILEKGLFGRATQGKLTPVVATAPAAPQAAAAAAPAPAVNDLTLLGTAVGSSRESFALIAKGSTKEERVFRLGESVYGAGPLVSIRKEVAEISVNGRRVKILTPMAVAANPPPTQQVQPAPAAGGLASPTGSGNYVIDQRALNAALDNIGTAMTDARLLPSTKDGRVEGFRASEVKPQGVFGMVGIRNGDVLLRVNDFPIDSPEKAIQSLASLKGQSRIKLDLIRDGQPTTLNYEIR